MLIVIVAIIAIVSNFFTEVVTIVSVIIFYVLGIYFSNKYLDKISNWKKKFKIQKTFYELEIDKKLVLLLSDSQSQLKRVSQNEFLELLPLSDILKIKSYTLKTLH